MLAISPAFGPGTGATEATEATDDADDAEVIQITGFRPSLQTSRTIKRDSEVVVDSITADDIGALPDRSVAETLQRVPGVSIDRFAAGVDPDHFSIEGSGIVVGGLTWVRTELHGRDNFSANNGRILSFSDVLSQRMGGVDAFNRPAADMIEGGISGTINLRTRRLSGLRRHAASPVPRKRVRLRKPQDLPLLSRKPSMRSGECHASRQFLDCCTCCLRGDDRHRCRAGPVARSGRYDGAR
ncbi:TonB-dependent receptor plug domain-containing protein [Maricaulis sp.]|uniref:TonB-dependent receptor plug domain-containing protein n=1 Tax=Maricaulis sp. TaxID=1486257 RepID=UPI0025BE1A80|nr:TonB-dependent receptor plug domain-containing protein [Maricaulis sp.]